MLRKSLRLELLAAFFIFGIVGFWKMRGAFLLPESTFVGVGDAQATLAWIDDLTQRFRTHGLGMLWGDLYTTDRFGGGLLAVFPIINPLWKLLYALLGQILAPDDVYDVVCALGFVLQGVSAYYLGRRVGLRKAFSFLFAFFTISLENTAFRLTGHIGLAFLSFPLLFLAWTWDAAQAPSTPRFLRAALGLWLSFLLNEYLGYFAAWAGLTLFVAIRAQEKSTSWAKEIRTWLIPGACAGVLLVAALSLSYPATLWGRFYLPPQAASPRTSHPFWHFNIFSLKNPLAPFQPGFDFLVSLTPSALWRQRNLEFTFRIGCIIPLFILGFRLMFKRFEAKNPQTEPLRRAFRAAKPWLWVALVAFLLGLHPQYRALSWLTIWFAPMFRVSARAFHYFDVAILMAFFLLLQALWEARTELAQWKVFRSNPLHFWLPVGVLFLWLAFTDMAGSGNPFKSYAVHPLPSSISLVRKLSPLPSGMVLEIPFVSEAEGQRPEVHYAAMMHTAFHGKPTLNGILNARIVDPVGRFSWLLSSPSPATVPFLEKVGVRYLVVWNSAPQAPHFETLAGLRVIARDDHGKVYEIPEARPWDKESFLSAASQLPEHPFAPLEK